MLLGFDLPRLFRAHPVILAVWHARKPGAEANELAAATAAAGLDAEDEVRFEHPGGSFNEQSEMRQPAENLKTKLHPEPKKLN